MPWRGARRQQILAANMTEPENFLERWSKRKIAERDRSSADQTSADQTSADQRTADHRASDDDHQASAVAPPRNDATAPSSSGETCDLTQLPSIDSIGADTDVTAFLRPGVPAELTRAALRRAWTSDPAIRDFVGLVENGWDFNDPSAMPGFGPISPEEVARLTAQIIGILPKASSPEPAAQNRVAAQEQSQLAQSKPGIEGQFESASGASQSEQGEDGAVQQSEAGQSSDPQT
jgi:hypothetical protein